MKKTFKFIFTLSLSVATAAFLGSCGNSSDKKNETEHHEGDGHDHAKEGHDHAEGEEHHHGSDENYSTQLKTAPESPQAGQEVMLLLTPKLKKDEKAEVPLEVNHEKKMHLIAVSEDLSTFQHLHPEYQASGSYDVKATFPTGGKYLLFADYKPSEGGEVADKLPIIVGGKANATTSYSAEKLTWTNNGLSLTLQTKSGKFVTGKEQHINGLLTQDGRTLKVETLENYLGAKAHVVMIEMADKDYVHVHPGTENGNFHLHVTFEHAGMYRAWIQFVVNGKVQVADFVLNVVKSDGKTDSAEHKH
ncbi:hypothetical protein [Runella salmonicolor]|uniref:Uncharacterized protein n=1 Tax=Runella salmonicolor TaxID=2950278 RepID=A0ABT1FWH4_9BACT|nr:hypothetical protein [Runella salmonicolor]MCP1385820.1 hypothetical protein [Runella salmonicolor]